MRFLGEIVYLDYDCILCFNILLYLGLVNKFVVGRIVTRCTCLHICSTPKTVASIQLLNPRADPFPDPISAALSSATAPSPSLQPPSGTRTKLPPMSGRQRKSNVNSESPETEFLKSKVDTLRGIFSQNDEAIKKLKQSNDLKAKRINQLESQVQEAQKLITDQTRTNNDNTNNQNINIPTGDDSSPRVNLLEQRMSFKVDQMSLLNSKVSDIQHNSCSKLNSTTFMCFDFEYETKSREELRQRQHACQIFHM